MLHFDIDPDVLNLLQNSDQVAKHQQDQEQTSATGRIGEGGGQGLSMETGKGLSQKSDSEDDGAAAIGKEGMKKDGSRSAVNGAGGDEGWMVGGQVSSGTRLAVLMAVALVLL